MVTQQLQPVEPQTCHGLLQCASMELLLLSATMFVLFFLATVVDLRDALSVVDAEQTRLRNEADAFGAFASRVADLEPAVPRTSASPGVGTLVDTGSTDELRRIREAYRETVMAVSHYEAEYDESLARNMAVEFGDDVAAAVVHDATLTPNLKETIVQRSRQARENRLVLADYLEEESSAVGSALDTLDRVRRSVDRIEDAPIERYDYDDLRAEWYLLEDRIEECESVLTRRQETLQERRPLGDRVDDVESLEEYIYEPLSVTYPVLTCGTRLLDRLRTVQEYVAEGMATRQ